MGLTVGGQVDAAVIREELVALPLALVLGGELLGRDSDVLLASVVDLGLAGIVGLH